MFIIEISDFRRQCRCDIKCLGYFFSFVLIDLGHVYSAKLSNGTYGTHFAVGIDKRFTYQILARNSVQGCDHIAQKGLPLFAFYGAIHSPAPHD